MDYEAVGSFFKIQAHRSYILAGCQRERERERESDRVLMKNRNDRVSD